MYKKYYKANDADEQEVYNALNKKITLIQTLK